MSVVNDESTLEFKQKLIKREIAKKENDSSLTRRACMKSVIEFRTATSAFYFYSCIYLLQRILTQQRTDVFRRHNKKLQELYGGKVFIPESKSYISNLSSYQLSSAEQSLLNKGLKFSIRSPVRDIDRKLEMERLYMSCLLYTSPSPRDKRQSRMPSSA